MYVCMYVMNEFYPHPLKTQITKVGAFLIHSIHDYIAKDPIS